MMDWTIYIKAFRDPTMKDVEEQATKIKAKFWREDGGTDIAKCREYWLLRWGVSDPELLERVLPGVRPDWRSMLQRMGSDWA